MKILLVITQSITGGAQVFVLNLARSLKERGLDIEVVAGDGEYLFKELKKYGIVYYHVKSLKRNINVYNALYFIYELYTLLKVKKYNVVHFNSSNTLIGALSVYLQKNRPKTAFTFHGLSLIDKNYKLPLILKNISFSYFRIFLKMIDKVVFECNLNYEEAKKAKIIDKADIIFNGLDEREMVFSPANDARYYFSSCCNIDLSKNFLIGSTGRLVYQKNYEFLINSFSLIKDKIPKAKVVIIGDGPEKDNYKKLISKLGFEKDIFLIGEITNSYKYLKGLDVFTLTSRYEGISISMIEALFSCVPILASNIGGNCDIVGNCDGQLFKLNNANEYVEKLLYIKKNKAEFETFNATMKSNFSLENMAMNYIKIFES